MAGFDFGPGTIGAPDEHTPGITDWNPDNAIRKDPLGSGMTGTIQMPGTVGGPMGVGPAEQDRLRELKSEGSLGLNSPWKATRDEAARGMGPEELEAKDARDAAMRNEQGRTGTEDIVAGTSDTADALAAFGADTPIQEQASEDYIEDESTVQGQLDTILDSDNKLIKQARARGKAAEQAGGYQGSAGQEGREAAMINAALPIAQQDAATFARFAENEQTADIAKDMQSFTHNLGVQLNQMNINAAEKQGIMSMVGSMAGNYMTMINQVNQNTDLPEADKKAIQSMYATQAKNFFDLFGMFGGVGMNWGGA